LEGHSALKAPARVSLRVIAGGVCLLALLRPSTLVAQPTSIDSDADVDAGPIGDAAPPPDSTSEALPPAAPPLPVVPLLEVTGQVWQRGTRDPLIGVNVGVDGSDGTESDAGGSFTLRLAAGPHVLSFQHPGHEAQALTITVGPQLAPLVVRLARNDGSERYETVVRAPRQPAQAPVVPLDKVEMTETPGSLGDPFRVIESLPGVTTALWPLPAFAVRGSNPGSTGFFLDDLRLPALFHFALGPAVIHPHLIESIDFFPGGYPARFGRFTGGIVAASTTSPPADRLRGSIDVRLYDVGLMLSFPIDDGAGTVTVAGRYAYPGALLALLNEDVALQYWDYQLRVDHRLGPGKATLFAFGSYDRLETDREFGPHGEDLGLKNKLVLLFHRLDLRWRGRVGQGWLSAGVAGGFDKSELPVEDNPLEVQARSVLPRVSYDRALGDALDLVVGADGDVTSYRRPVGDDRRGQAEFLEPRTVIMAGVFTSLAARLGDRLVVTPGLRLDFFQERTAQVASDHAVSPRLALRLQLHETVWLKAIGGHFNQMPHLPFQLPTFEGFGLAKHGLQSAWQGALGVEHKSPWGLEFEATSFINRGTMSDMRDPDFGDPLLDDFLIRREALAYGAEIMIRRPSTHRLHGWLSYTLSRSDRLFEGGVVGPSDFDQRHTLNLVTSYTWGRNTFGGRLHFHTGRLVKIDDAEPLDMARLPAFYQLDVRVARRFVFDRYRLEAYLELVNATLRPQVVGLSQSENGQGTGIERDQFRLVLPSLGIRAEF
jgi:hypothetical protein